MELKRIFAREDLIADQHYLVGVKKSEVWPSSNASDDVLWLVMMYDGDGELMQTECEQGDPLSLLFHEVSETYELPKRKAL